MDAFPSPFPHDRHLLRRIAEGYSRMCQVRQLSEISSRNALGPLTEFQINESGIMLQRATHDNQNIATRIFLPALMDFAADCFDEFQSLSKEERWIVIHNCYETVLFLDGTYRVQRDFPNHPNLLYGHMTSIIDSDNIDDFFGSPNTHTPDVIREMKNNLRESSLHCRNCVRGIDTEEYYAMLGLVLWNTEDSCLTENIVSIFEKYRRALLEELHSYYSSVMEDEYAVRIGRLFDAIRTIKSGITDFRIAMETVRLLDVVGDDTFIWHLVRT